MRTYSAQKAGLTRTTNALARCEKAVRELKGRETETDLKAIQAYAQAVAAECTKAVRDWEGSYWPDGWHRWNIALGDAAYAYRRAGGTDPAFPNELDELR